jgi:hypothetical protein
VFQIEDRAMNNVQNCIVIVIYIYRRQKPIGVDPAKMFDRVYREKLERKIDHILFSIRYHALGTTVLQAMKQQGAVALELLFRAYISILVYEVIEIRFRTNVNSRSYYIDLNEN